MAGHGSQWLAPAFHDSEGRPSESESRCGFRWLAAGLRPSDQQRQAPCVCVSWLHAKQRGVRVGPVGSAP
jgi:hypothetical protein